ncbi:hypothetical protein [Nonomuraea sp. NPDC050643]|uniref:hypothetical protein n=1 Tax=Nonomuraea sp. NPDC050643 TaxID=3155660 RepID=UPI0033F5BE2C
MGASIGAEALAAPEPGAKELRRQLSEQQKELDALIGDYNAKRVSLVTARKSEQAARARLRAAQRRYEQAQQGVRELATLRYQQPDLNLAIFAAGADPSTILRRAAILEQLAAEETALVAGFTKVRDNITPRMRNVRNLIRQRFALSYGVGCYRGVNDGGEHPLGRACDFMVSSGGAMPSPEQARLGDEISEWVIENAQRLGIMYVIYRQRIWHVRTGAWKYMSDRGGVTANHYDHPHISVY